MKKNKRIIITGSSGFIGTHLTKALLEKEHCVLGIDKIGAPVDFIGNKNFDFQLCDFKNAKIPTFLAKETDAVFHLAGTVSVDRLIRQPEIALDENFAPTQSLIEKLYRENNKIAFILASSDRVYSSCFDEKVTEDFPVRALEPYGFLKLAIENLCRIYQYKYHFPLFIVRAANVYGPGQSNQQFIRSAIEQLLNTSSKIRVGNLKGYRNFIYVDDLVDFYVRLLQCRSISNVEWFNVSGSGAYVSAILEKLIKIAKKRTGTDYKIFIDKGKCRMGRLEPPRMKISFEKATKILGWEPKISIDSGLQRTFEYYFQGKTNGKQ